MRGNAVASVLGQSEELRRQNRLCSIYAHETSSAVCLFCAIQIWFFLLFAGITASDLRAGLGKCQLSSEGYLWSEKAIVVVLSWQNSLRSKRWMRKNLSRFHEVLLFMPLNAAKLENLKMLTVSDSHRESVRVSCSDPSASWIPGGLLRSFGHV